MAGEMGRTDPLWGKIKTVYCKKFVTYEECVFEPIEYLNVIVGPNGTGKSTLVSAIILGLGGEPKLLSRASSISDYIKNGHTEAIIEINIYVNSEETILFSRILNADGKSEFNVDGKQISKNLYLREVAKFNIQLGNLCQFLPQDRVQDFAKMNSQELLLNTMTSACTQEVVDNFDTLKRLRKRQVSELGNLESEKNKLNDLIIRRNELQKKVETYKTHKEYTDKLEACKAKKLWLCLDHVNLKLIGLKSDFGKATDSLRSREAIYNAISKRNKLIEATRTKLLDKWKKSNNDVQTIKNNINQTKRFIEELFGRIKNARLLQKKRKREIAEIKAELSSQTGMLQVFAHDFEQKSIESMEENCKKCEVSMEKVKNLIRFESNELKSIENQIDMECAAETQHLKRKLAQIESVFEIKLENLRRTNGDVYKAYQWLQSNRHLFSGVVYEPILLTINVHDANHSKYLENTIAFRDIVAFTCEEKADVGLLLNELRVKQQLCINVVHSPAATECKYTPEVPIAKLKRYGFTGYLIDLISAPPAILNYLCSLYSLHKIPIGGDQVRNNTEIIPENIKQYYGGDDRFVCSKSKYTRDKCLVKYSIQTKNLLICKDEKGIVLLKKRICDIAQHEETLKQRQSALQAKIVELEAQIKALNKKRKETLTSITDYNNSKVGLENQKKVVARLEAKLENIERQNDFESSIQKDLSQLIRLHGDCIKLFKKFNENYIKKILLEERVRIYAQETEEIIRSYAEAKTSKESAENILVSVKRSLDELQKRHDLILERAKSASNNCKPGERNFPYKDIYNTLPNSSEELDDVIDETSARLECMSDVDQQVIADFERIGNDIVSTTEMIKTQSHMNTNCEAEIKAIYDVWILEVLKVVKTLNVNFSTFMQSLKYIGEVNLDRKEELDFESYGIKIMVQFRTNVALQQLDKNKQSGGERAVAIAVYTLSLQHITHVPFRCVDEINQGMDARNERKIFEMLVSETTKKDRAQYFFVTPKLLPMLPYNDHVKIHIVFNGASVSSLDVFKIPE